MQGDAFFPAKPRLWSDKTLVNPVNLGRKNVDLAPDGKRVVVLMPMETQPSQHHVVYLGNFFDELRRRAPVKR